MDAAKVPLDGREFTRLIHASIKKSKHESRKDNHREAQHYLELADKLSDAKEDLYQKRFNVADGE